MLQRVFHLRLWKHVSDNSMTWVVVFEDYFLNTRTKWPGSQRSVLKAWEEHEDHTSAWELLPSQLQLLGCSVSCLCGRKQGPETTLSESLSVCGWYKRRLTVCTGQLYVHSVFAVVRAHPRTLLFIVSVLLSSWGTLKSRPEVSGFKELG